MADPSGGSGEPLNFFLLRSTVNISYIFAEIYADSIPRPEFALFFVGAAAGNWAGQVGGSAESPTGQLIATEVAESLTGQLIITGAEMGSDTQKCIG